MAKHREYPIALKRAALARLAAGESVTAVARALRVRGRLLYAWRDKVRRVGPRRCAGWADRVKAQRRWRPRRR